MDELVEIHKDCVIIRARGVTKTLRCLSSGRVEIRQQHELIPGEPDKVIQISSDGMYAFVQIMTREE